MNRRRAGRLGNRGGDREQRIAEMARELIGADEPPRPLLFCDDGGAFADDPPGQAGPVSRWTTWAVAGDSSRRSTRTIPSTVTGPAPSVDPVAGTGPTAGTGTEPPAGAFAGPSPTPPEGRFAAATLRLPRDWGRFEMLLGLLAGRLSAGSPLYVYGAHDEGIRSIESHTRGEFDEARTLGTRRRARVVRLRRSDRPAARSRLEDWLERATIMLPAGGEREIDAQICFYPGTFAGGGLDPGTALLLGVLDRLPLRGRLIDFGCGAGLITLAARALAPEIEPVLLDADSIALDAARQNVPGAGCLCSDGWSDVGADRRFDLILSNPPIHRGKEEDCGVLESLVLQAPHRLRPGGCLVAVIQASLGAGRLFRRAAGRADRMAASPGYEVWRLRP